MRRALLATSAIVAFALASYACGSDDDTNSDIPAPAKDGGKTSSSGNSSGNTSSGNTSGNTSSGNTSSSSSGDASSGNTSSGNTSNGGTPPIDDAGSVKDGSSITDSGTPDANEADGSAGTLCQVGSIQETETNNDSGTADVITGDHAKFCGTASSTDVDFITFTMPVDANSFSLAVNTTDALLVEGTIDGANSFALTGQDAGSSIPLIPGGKYVIKASTTTAKADYIVQLDISHSPASTKCATGLTKEAEDNATTPNTMPTAIGASSFCGTINTAADTDKFKFQMPATAGTFTTNFSSTGSNFTLSCTVKGQTVVISNPATPNLPFEKNEDYVCTATSTTANNGYIFTLTTAP